MKVILLKDVPKLGKKYDVKEVANGFARNSLFPQKLAEIATPSVIASIELRKKQDKQFKEVDKDILNKNIESLKDVKITISEKANEKGHLFAGVHKEEIVSALKSQKNINIPEELIELNEPIKEIGEHKIRVKNIEFILEIVAK